MQDLRLGIYPANGIMAPHMHQDSSFTIVIHGSYHENIRGQSLEHRGGSMLFYPAGEVHSQQFGQNGSRKVIFRPCSSSLGLLADEQVKLAQAPYVSSASIRALGLRAANEMRQKDIFTGLVVEGILLELMGTFARLCESKSRTTIPSWLKQCRERLEAQPEIHVTHEDLASLVKKHPVHIAREFRAAYGETIGDFQRRLRLNKAERLLQERRMSLTEIALECGFSSHSHFSHSFSKAFGLAPAKYRQLA